MTDQDYRVEIESDTEGHLASDDVKFAPDDDRWMADLIGREGDSARIRLMPSEEDDTEGHGRSATLRLRALPEDGDDTEGHAISLHFPNAEAADQFRRRLIATGVIAATVTLGALGGTALSSMNTSPGDAVTPTVVTEGTPSYVDAARNQALSQEAARQAASQEAADRDKGIMDASGAGAAAGAAGYEDFGQRQAGDAAAASGSLAAGYEDFGQRQAEDAAAGSAAGDEEDEPPDTRVGPR